MILISYGTRPEWIKIKPIIDRFKENDVMFKILFTGQHTHIANFDYDHSLKIEQCENRLNEVISSVLKARSAIFEEADYVLVQGDTASTYAVALAAFNHGVKVIHLEAGLRTYDLENPYPEEVYRQMISRIANIHFCATVDNKDNLLQERCAGKKYVVGNTVLDNLRDIQTTYGEEVLVTMHRRENHDIMDEWFSTMNQLAAQNPDLKFIIPLHPNPNVQKQKHLLTNFHITEPLQYKDMIEKIANCKFIISDSGGIQEEASFLNKRVIVCRKFTERTESLGTHSILCESPQRLAALFEDIKQNFEIDAPSPYGDGLASNRIYNILQGDKNGNL